MLGLLRLQLMLGVTRVSENHSEYTMDHKLILQKLLILILRRNRRHRATLRSIFRRMQTVTSVPQSFNNGTPTTSLAPKATQRAPITRATRAGGGK